jgi:alkanesulfonate monooxygenase SsuD/methylene tetrahydromethanopterin reductase-like flavin-dependent oxidoreductase (luciferase family)
VAAVGAATVRPRVGVVVLPDEPWPAARGAWRQVEDLGLDHAWTYDHISWRDAGSGPWFDAASTLVAAAAATTRIRLGTLVSSPNLRHPVTTASQAMTIDHISGGRFVLGIGAGAGGPDSTVLGGPALPPADRADRFEEFVMLADLVLRQPTTTFRGRFFAADGARMVPGCRQQPRVPFAMAASGPRGMALAARYAEIWVTIGAAAAPGSQPESAAFGTLRRQLDRLAAACTDAGRDPASLRRLVNLSRIAPAPFASADRFADLVGRCAELAFTDVVVTHPPAAAGTGERALFERAVGAVAAARTAVGAG